METGDNGIEAPSERFSLRGYVIINLIAWAVLLVLFALLGWMLKDWTGMGSFFIILAGAFTLASVFDAVYDRLTIPAGEGDHASGVAVQTPPGADPIRRGRGRTSKKD